MKKFLLVAIPVAVGIAACAAIVLTHKEEARKYAGAAMNWGTEKLDKAYAAARKCAEQYDISPDDIVV